MQDFVFFFCEREIPEGIFRIGVIFLFRSLLRKEESGPSVFQTGSEVDPKGFRSLIA